jgi:hypothetical protein
MKLMSDLIYGSLLIRQYWHIFQLDWKKVNIEMIGKQINTNLSYYPKGQELIF